MKNPFPFSHAKMEKEFRNGNLDDVCDEVASVLMIDADGGDSPGAAVRDAFIMVLNERAAQRAERHAAEIRAR